MTLTMTEIYWTGIVLLFMLWLFRPYNGGTPWIFRKPRQTHKNGSLREQHENWWRRY